MGLKLNVVESGSSSVNINQKEVRLSVSQDLENAYESLLVFFPELSIDRLRHMSPRNIAEELDNVYRKNNPELPIVPKVPKEMGIHTWLDREDDERWWERVPINLCNKENYWNCVWVTSVFVKILEKLGYEFDLLAELPGTHALIKVYLDETKENFELISFEDVGVRFGDDRVSYKLRNPDDLYVISNFPDGMSGLSLMEFFLILKSVEKDEANLALYRTVFSEILKKIISENTLSGSISRMELITEKFLGQS